jgi:hypothetical protein
MVVFNQLYCAWLWIKMKFKMFSFFVQNISAQAENQGHGTQAICSLFDRRM